MKTPNWFLKKDFISCALWPLSMVYYVFSSLVFNVRKHYQYKSQRPIICFGNILAGGVGKTPIVRNVAKFFDAPVVMRGYKKSKDTAFIGDEAKMLSNDGILVHVGNRKSNLVLLNKQKAKTPIIMDDGFQNSSIKKDISVLVFDQSIGFGNGFILPAGPLREPKSAMKRADAIIVIKRDTTAPNFSLPVGTPVFYAENQEICPFDEDTPVVAFAGIGYPDKFFKNVPVNIVEKYAFPDHYQYKASDIKDLIEAAKARNAKLLTTEKDWVRLPKWAQKQIQFSKLNTQIEDSFYDWLKERINDHYNKKS